MMDDATLFFKFNHPLKVFFFVHEFLYMISHDFIHYRFITWVAGESTRVFLKGSGMFVSMISKPYGEATGED